MRAEIRVTSRLAVNDPAVLHAATAAGLGIGILPEFLCRQGLATGRLKLLLPDWELPQIMPLYAVYPATQGADSPCPVLRGFPRRQRGAGAGADLTREV